MRNWRRITIFLIFALAFVLRLKSLGWGLPDFLEDTLSVDFLRDFWGVFSGRLTFHPYRYDWSPFYYYLVFLWQGLYYLGGRFSGAFADLTSWRLFWVITPAPLYYWGRLLTVGFALASLGVLYRLGELFFPRRVVILGMLLCSCDPIFLRYSQTLQTDVPQLFFFLVASYFVAKIYLHGRFKDYLGAGIAIGLGAATKYTPLILVLPAVTAHALRCKTTAAPWFSRKLAWLLALPPLVFILALPYSVLDFKNFWQWISYQIFHLQVGHFTDRGPWLFPGIGLQSWWLHLLVLGSTLYYLKRAEKVKAVLLLFPPLFLYFFIIRNATFFDYYLLPIFPVFYLIIANAFQALGRSIGGFLPQSRRLVQGVGLFALTALFLVPLIQMDWQVLHSREQKSTYTMAREWLEANVPSKTILVSELVPPQVQEYHFISLALRSTAFAQVVPLLVDRLALRPVYFIHKLKINVFDPQSNVALYNLDNYRLFEYFIVNSHIASRYRRDPARYPLHNRFYEAIGRDFREVARFEPQNEIDPQIIVYQNPAPRLTSVTPLSSIFLFSEVQKKYQQELSTINSYLARYGIPAATL